MSPTWVGWQERLPRSFAQQAVGTDETRAALLARAQDVVRFIETDISNLRLGLSLGYAAPRSGVEATIRLTDSLLGDSPEASPFFEPAARDGTEAIAGSLLSVIENEINPAIKRYRDFLNQEYLPAARNSIAATDTPGGDRCYASAIRSHTSLSLSPEEIHETGLREMERLHEQMRVIGRRSFGNDEPAELLQHVRSNPAFRFESEQEILDYARTAMERAKVAVPKMFGFVPQAEIVVTPFPKYLKLTGGGTQTAGSPDGSIPAKFEIGTYDPKSLGKAEIEATTFHEAFPGHHLQTAVAMEKGGVHPVLRYFFFNGTGEGWALYTERLADETGLYSSDLSQIGRSRVRHFE